MAKRKTKTPLELRGQLMLQISAGRFFRSGVEINEHVHRRTLYTNVWFLGVEPIELPVGILVGSDEHSDVSTAMLEATDRLEAQRWDDTDEFLVATGGDELIDDIAYVMTFVLNRTFSRDHDLVHRLVLAEGSPVRRRTAASLFPQLFDRAQVVQGSDWDAVRALMADLLELNPEDFARVMRVIRSTVDATRRAIDDPTGSYTDIVAALESLGEDSRTVPTTWDRYDPAKRKILDAALEDVDDVVTARVRTAILEADRAGLKRRFVASTRARVAASYFREEAIKTVRPPRSVELERMLSIAYDVRSRRSHVLQDLGDEAWVYTDGAETTYEGRLEHILTLAGLWRLTRHVVHRFVADADKTGPEPWDYRGALPGQIQVQLAPQFWIGQAEGFNAKNAAGRFNGVAEAVISWLSGENNDGFNLTQVVEKIERLVPLLDDCEAKTAMVATYVLWHRWLDPKHHRPSAADFIERYGACLDPPTPIGFAVGILSRRGPPAWTPDEWAAMASSRHAVRESGKGSPLPASIDALIQLETARQLEAVGRHDEAIIFAAHAVEECPGHPELMEWEKRLLSGDHDIHFDDSQFVFGSEPAADAADAITADTTGQTRTG